MTLTDRSMEWLNQNRYRSYPVESGSWREKVSPESGLDCVLLDATVFDADSASESSDRLSVCSISVSFQKTDVVLSYRGFEFGIKIEGGTTSGENSFKVFRGNIRGGVSRSASISVVTSSHAYILDRAGEGHWDIGCDFLRSRVVSISDGYGVDGIHTGGSNGVYGHDEPSVSTGEVYLEDGYRTSPIVRGGDVVVRVGRQYGIDPCKFDFGESARYDCKEPLFFFCGQNAINSGNVILRGGSGVSVVSGGEYSVKSGTCKGKKIPCIEIIAGRELIDMCKSAQ